MMLNGYRERKKRVRLKALEVQGFKTFPEKTRLGFTDGITAVVGPNGSGKSNISDAIRWVLGEQSAKALRCSRMEDVIFNGTKERKKAGYAQVTLSFDNSDRALQFDGDEVAVTRRYYRSGNSEYLINNTAVRLQDIHELFMDTGLGRDGYSMIGQGKIDSIVAARSEDRREIFEEAAGISKFRYKKAEAERRLDRTEDNLVRLRDILSELEGRVEPLRIQSEKAKSFLTYETEKKGLEITLWLKSLEKADAALKEQDDKLAVANAQRDEIENLLENIRSEIENNLNERNKFNAEADIIRREISSSEEEAAELRSKAEVLKNDIKHNDEAAVRIGKEIEGLVSSVEDHKKEIEKKNDELGKISADLKTERDNEAECTQKLLDLRGGESESADKIAAVNAAVAELTDKASDAKISFMTSSAAINDLTERRKVINNNIDAHNSKIGTLESIISNYQASVKKCDDDLAKLNDEKRELIGKKNENKRKSEELKKQADACYLKAQQLSSKANMLSELERNLEGFLQSVKNIMREANRGGLTGIHGPVSRVIKTPARFSTAIEIALGGAMQNIVTSDDEAAKQAIRFLKSTGGGRATFLPMTTIKGRELNEKGIEDCRGFVGIAAELCSCEDCYRGILLNLLGRIVVAENLDRAVEIAKKYSYRFRVVTLDGQVVNAGGSLTGGSLTKNAGLLGRASEIEKLKKQAVETKNKAKEDFDRLASEQKKLGELEESAKRSGEELSTAQGDMIKLEAEIRSRNTELETTEKSLQETQTERESSVEKMNELTQAMVSEFIQKIEDKLKTIS